MSPSPLSSTQPAGGTTDRKLIGGEDLDEFRFSEEKYFEPTRQ
jgi:hypothetical protein